jgi:hypothetical protein
MKRLFGLFVLLLAFPAFAQEDIVISPQSIVVNPRPSFTVEVWVDKDRSGEGAPTYQIGEAISIGVRVSEAAYVYLFNVRSNGQIQQILPNRYDQAGQNNYLSAGETKYFPPPNAAYTFNVDGPRGLDKVIAVASKEQLNTRQLADFTADPNFATSTQSQESFAQALSIIVRPIAQTNWVTDTALFYVGAAPSVPLYGTLDLRSSPSGAAAYVDGQFVGYTPVRFGTTAGSHEVRLELSGYNTYTTTVTLSGGQTLQVDAGLSAVRRTGQVTFASQPQGAQVFVGGQQVGTTPTGSLTLDEGSYQARFSRAGYDDVTVSFSVGANTSQTVSATLQPQVGALVVRANVGGAVVFVNGEQRGTVPNGTGRLDIGNLPAGTHEVVVVAPGFRTFMQEVTVRSGQTTEVRVQQSRR